MLRESIEKHVAGTSQVEATRLKPELPKTVKTKTSQSTGSVRSRTKPAKVTDHVVINMADKPEQKKGKRARKAREVQTKPTGPAGSTRDRSSPDDTATLVARIELLEKEVKILKEGSERLVGGTKRLLLHNCREPVIQAGKARREADHKHVQAIFSVARLPSAMPYAKCHRVGLWKGEGKQGPRPLLLVFGTMYSRDLLLSRAARVHSCTGGQVQITPDLPHLAKPSVFRAPRVVEFKEPVVQLNRVEEPPITTSTPKPLKKRVSKSRRKRAAAKKSKQLLEESHVDKGLDKLSQPQSSTPDKDATVRKHLAEVSRTRSVSCGSTVPVSWIPILVPNHPDGAQAGGKGPTGEVYSTRTELYVTFEAGPCSTKSMEQGNLSEVTTGEEQPPPESKNVVTPRVLRPRVHPA